MYICVYVRTYYLTLSNPGVQAIGSWAWAPRLRHLTLSNPGLQAIGSWA